MTKFYGPVGYAQGVVESPPGVWTDNIVEKSYFGDVVRTARRLEDSASQTKAHPDTILPNNSISVVADAYAIENFFAIRYVRWQGAVWTVTEVEVLPPRLLLRLGGVYNGPTLSSP